ncbi:flagellar basal-body rod protein FlgB [Paenibacillus sabinae T27]|uniref:Flagellar basal body rod protein FlgB n=1 Tax=Paenibacillus sabinae T27 TaxID=1268072 RepID=X4ZMQ5_9BACL|nr:flagellar basal-body rod protein FlgB [Paenibacillus sabinae T27]
MSQSVDHKVPDVFAGKIAFFIKFCRFEKDFRKSCGILFIMIALEGGLTLGLLNSISFLRLQRGIDAATMRQNALANNVANVDTPGFKRSDVSFESFLREQESGLQPSLGAKVTDLRHIRFGTTGPIPSPVIRTDETTTMNNNDNNVDIDREMALSAENQLRYSSYVQLLSSQISMMRTATEGR